MRNEFRTVEIRVDSPPKPERGAPCNGCGVCCAAITCPAARLVFRRRTGPCPALEWHAPIYRCGFLATPGRYFPRLPPSLHGLFTRLIHRWIAAGTACDSDAEPG